MRLTLEIIAGIKTRVKLFPKERLILEEILLNRKVALTLDFTYLGRVGSDIYLPYKIKTIPYTL